MAILTDAARHLQHALGSELDGLARQAGAVRRQRIFSGSSLLQALVLTTLRCPAARWDDYATTACALGAVVTPRAVGKRFTPALLRFLRLALARLLERAVSAPAVAVELLGRFSAVLVGDSTTIPLPDGCAAEFPGCGGKADSGQATLKVQVCWDLLAGRLVRLLLEPGRRHDSASAAVAEVPPPGSLSLYDLGFFDTDRLGRWTRAGAHWISRLPPRVAVFDADGTPLDLPADLGRLAVGGRLDRAVLLGAACRLACRLIALRVPPELAERRRRKMRERAVKQGRTPGAAALAMCEWATWVTDCEESLLSWREVVILYRARWQVELLFKLWKSHNRLAAGGAAADGVGRMCEVWAKLMAVVVQHWAVVAASWDDPRRSLWKVAALVRAHAMEMARSLGDVGRLAGVLGAIAEAVPKVGRVGARRKAPSHFQLLLDARLLDW